MVEYIIPSERGLTHQTFLSGDELPCGFILCNYEACEECSCDCGGQVHNIELNIIEKDLRRWVRAGKMLRSIVSEFHPNLIGRGVDDSRRRSVTLGNSDMTRHAQDDIVEPPESHTACSTSNSAAEAVVRIAQGITDGHQGGPWNQQIAPSGEVPLPPRTLLCRHKARSTADGRTNQEGYVDSDYCWAANRKYFCARAKNLQSKAADNLISLLGKNPLHFDHGYGKNWYALALLLTIAYGGLHMIAWNYSFPTEVERLFWRSSCILLMLFFLLCQCVVVPTRWALNVMDDLDDDHHNSLPLRLLLVGVSIVFNLPLVFILIACVFARVFIVVESLISLRTVPIGAMRQYHGSVMYHIYNNSAGISTPILTESCVLF